MSHRLLTELSRPLRALLWLLCFAAWTVASTAAVAQDAASIEWTERTVDLYVNAEHRPDGIVLRSSESDAWAVLLPNAPIAWILSPDAEDEGRGTVHTEAASEFEWVDPLHATSPAGTGERDGEVAGTWTEVDGGWFAQTAGHAFVALPHQGPAGPIDRGELWRAVPSWKRLAGAWRPEAEGEAAAMEVLSRLAGPGNTNSEATNADVTFEVVFGTWCGDSRRSVPKLLAAADELGLEVSLVAMRRGFEEPLDYARDHRITNVPTILVRRRGLEIGRFVESPRLASVIADLAAILERRPVPPPERFSDSDVLVARGEYVLTSRDGVEVGRETWSLFRTESGGTRLGSRHVGSSGGVTEVWQRWTADDEGGRTGFVEITRDARGELSRTRLSRKSGPRNNDAVHALTRGDAGGIVEQDLSVPAETVVLGPSVASRGLVWNVAGRPESAQVPVLVVPGAGEGFAARLDDAELRHVARLDLYEPGLGDLAADHVVLRRGGARPDVYEGWLHAELGVPVRAEFEDVKAELVWLELAVDEPEG